MPCRGGGGTAGCHPGRVPMRAAATINRSGPSITACAGSAPGRCHGEIAALQACRGCGQAPGM